MDESQLARAQLVLKKMRESLHKLLCRRSQQELEWQGQILGRKTINFRVCTCPKRDMEVEEGKAAKKSASGSPADGAAPFGQGKIKMEVKRKGSAGDGDREYFIKVKSNRRIWLLL